MRRGAPARAGAGQIGLPREDVAEARDGAMTK
jgi:hypothetical protein